jgi:hypothetical protein
LADSVELQQVASAREVLRFSGMDQMGTATAPELQWICDRLREALHEVLRVAESRGERLL